MAVFASRITRIASEDHYLDRWSLIVVPLCLIGQVLTPGNWRTVMALWFAGALAAWFVLLRSAAKGHIGGVSATIAMLIALMACVALPPASSKDVESYALYGRMTSEYGVSPWSHTPRDFAADPFFPRISPYWSDSPSVYGPVFAVASAGVMELAKRSPLRSRIGFQALAAVALLVSVLIVSKRSSPPMAIVFVGLNPLLLTFGVNDGHCDLLAGLGIAGAVVVLTPANSKEPSVTPAAIVVAGMFIAFAVLVKVSLLPASLGAAVWLWGRRRSWWPPIVLLATVGVVVVVGFALAGGLDALEPLRSAAARHTRFSVWNPFHEVAKVTLGDGLPTQSPADRAVALAANVTVATAGLAFIWRQRRSADPVLAVIAGLAAYQLLGAYVLSWYAAWSLPALTLEWRSRTAALVMGHASLVAIAYLNGYLASMVLTGVLGWLAARWWRSRKQKDEQGKLPRPILARP